MQTLRRFNPWLYLLLGLAQAAHSVEEVLTGLWLALPAVTGWLQARLPRVPVLEWNAQGFAAANITIVALLLGTSGFVFLRQPWTKHLVRVVSFVEMLNGLGHLSAALLTGRYFSGSISAVFLFILGLLALLSVEKSYGSKNL
jgi:hypothetical protein